jgi:hypothetical protein
MAELDYARENELPETVDVKTGEIVEEVALAKKSDIESMVKEQDE